MVSHLTNLYYLSKGTWIQLPEWCHSYINLGTQLTQIAKSETRTVVAIAVPTRAYASAFIATGIVLAHAAEKYVGSDADEHYKFISSLPIGTPIVYRSAQRVYKGNVEEFSHDIAHGLMIKIKTGTKETKSEPLHTRASRIDVAETETKLHEYQNGRRLNESNALLEFCIGHEAAQIFTEETRFECLIVGKINNLHTELMDTTIAVNMNSENAILGCLQEILRVKQFMNPNYAYRTQAISSVVDDNDDKQKEVSVPIVIFDGSNAFLRNNRRYTNSHHIVILDRTERSFEEATTLLKDNYPYRVKTETIKFNSNFPLGTEAIIYQENCT